MNKILSIGVLTLAAACGGGSTANHTDQLTFEQLTTQSTASFASVAELDFFDISTLPTDGSATYRGTIEGNTADGIPDRELSLIGALDLEVEFVMGGLQMSGQAYGFFDEDGIRIDGALAISNVDFDASGNPQTDRTIEASLAGSLAPETGDQISLDLLIEGDFFGNSNPDYLAGLVFGRVRQGQESADFRGRFVSGTLR